MASLHANARLAEARTYCHCRRQRRSFSGHQGKEYLDANSSIWTNLHGHRHPAINAAITRQLGKIAHSSALGFANEPASLLGAQLIGLAAASPRQKLRRVFYSDDGSTAMEAGLKMAYEYARRTGNGRPKFLSLASAYHGDTIGAVSLGHIDRFHKAYHGLLFKTDQVPAPYCYRCPYNRARPERADARLGRKCKWECVAAVERKVSAQKKKGNPYAAFVFEPLMQGSAGMVAQPEGWLRRTTEIARSGGALLLADEVMTGFGRPSGAIFALGGVLVVLIPRLKVHDFPYSHPDGPLDFNSYQFSLTDFCCRCCLAGPSRRTADRYRRRLSFQAAGTPTPLLDLPALQTLGFNINTF